MNRDYMLITALRAEDMPAVASWRNKSMESLRTPFLLTNEMQKDFYNRVICSRNSDTRFFAVRYKDENSPIIGQFGINNICFENSNAEISMILDPNYRGLGLGTMLVRYTLNYAFDELGLHNVYGEVYLCNPAVLFWQKLIRMWRGTSTLLPERKRHHGELYDSIYFNFNRDDYSQCKGNDNENEAVTGS